MIGDNNPIAIAIRPSLCVCSAGSAILGVAVTVTVADVG